MSALCPHPNAEPMRSVHRARARLVNDLEAAEAASANLVQSGPRRLDAYPCLRHAAVRCGHLPRSYRGPAGPDPRRCPA